MAGVLSGLPSLSIDNLALIKTIPDLKVLVENFMGVLYIVDIKLLNSLLVGRAYHMKLL